MTFSDFKFYDSEVKCLVNKVLDSVKNKSFSDYVLLLAHGGYQIENEHTPFSPYVISSRLEAYLDRTREQFLVDYLNMYEGSLKDGIAVTNDYREYDLNVQMMIYAQVWESHQLLKSLKRIGSILTGTSYEWRISFEVVNKNGEVRQRPKGKIMEDQIMPALRKGSSELAQFVEKYYDKQLRNDFAHASYFISVEENAIMSLDSERYSIKKKTGLFEWDEIFINSVMLSYYLPHIIRERCDNFIKDYPEIPSVEIDWPSYIKPGKTIKTQIVPKENKWGVEFFFQA